MPFALRCHAGPDGQPAAKEDADLPRVSRGADRPIRTKDADDLDVLTGSVRLGVAITSFASIAQDCLHPTPWGAGAPKGRMIASKANLGGNCVEMMSGTFAE